MKIAPIGEITEGSFGELNKGLNCSFPPLSWAACELRLALRIRNSFHLLYVVLGMG